MATAFTPPPPQLAAATPQPPSSSASSSSAMIVIIVIASAVIISASIYLLLRVVSRRFRRSFSTTAADDVVAAASSSNRRVAPGDDLLHSLPLFTFRSLSAAGGGGGGDCAVCLSKFEPRDQLRLLPICCHAFHAACIDKWIAANQTCPLCRSTVSPYACDALDKILNPQNCPNSTSRSFRIELGSVSLRRDEAPPPPPAAAAAARRTYSIGSYDYTVDDCVYEVAAACTTHRREYSGDKEAEEVSGGRRSWLGEMSSRAMSFRSSGRFFGGSSRRSEAAVAPEDLEANRAGEEISEIFRWISGI